MNPASNGLLAAVLALGVPAAIAQSTPIGLWKTIDDETKQERSTVRITEAGGRLSGRIEKLIDPKDANAVCEKCTDERKGQPIVGLEILRGVTHDAKDAGLWSGGEILDPGNGSSYRVRLKPIEGGRRLEVRGYIGMPMLGRTQIWQRVE